MDAAQSRIALGLQALTLAHAEAVLFVDDGQGQPVELHRVLEQGVGADGDLGLARCQSRQLDAPFRRRVTSGEQQAGHARLLQHWRQLFMVLARQNLGRRHQGRLKAAGRRIGEGHRCNRRLARADVPLQQPSHLLAGNQVSANLGDGLFLCAGQGEGQCG